MWNGETPNDIEFSVFSDKTMDRVLSVDSIPTIELAGNADYNVWRCPFCKRLYIFNGKDSEPLYVFKPEGN